MLAPIARQILLSTDDKSHTLFSLFAIAVFTGSVARILVPEITWVHAFFNSALEYSLLLVFAFLIAKQSDSKYRLSTIGILFFTIGVAFDTLFCLYWLSPMAGAQDIVIVLLGLQLVLNAVVIKYALSKSLFVGIAYSFLFLFMVFVIFDITERLFNEGYTQNEIANLHAQPITQYHATAI